MTNAYMRTINVYDPETKRTFNKKVLMILPNQLAGDEDGFYAPRQIKGPGRKRKRVWIAFPDGFYSLLRGIKAAKFKGEYKDVPTLEELQKKVHWIKFTLLTKYQKGMNKVPNERSIKVKLIESHDQLRNRQKDALKEADDHVMLMMPLKDSKGRINVGAFSARLSAVDRRLEYALQDLYGWLPYYDFRFEKLAFVRKRIVRNLETAGINIRKHLDSLRTNPDQLMLTQQVIESEVNKISSFAGLKPFNRWFTHLKNDLTALKKAVATHDSETAMTIGQKMLVSIRLKWYQDRLNDIIMDLEEKIEMRRSRFGDIKKRVRSLQTKVMKLYDANFEHPVVSYVVADLSAALNSSSGKEIKAALKHAVDRL